MDTEYKETDRPDGPLIDLLSLDNVVFSTYIFWSAFLVLKMFALILATIFQRYITQNVISSEDKTLLIFCPRNKWYDDKGDYVERIRRAHWNDMENIFIHIWTGLLYVLTNPNPILAVNLFRLAALSRCLHSIVYTWIILPQPARFISFMVPFCVTGFMAIKSTMYFV